jgi:hypothetical protein
MAILLATCDLKQPGRDYTPVHDYLKRFTYCKGLESVWLLDTTTPCQQVRDNLKNLVDANDIVFVAHFMRDWAASNYNCGDWLNDERRNW